MDRKETMAEIAATLANELNNNAWEFGGSSVDYAIINPEGAPAHDETTILLAMEDGNMFIIGIGPIEGYGETPTAVSEDS